MKKLRISQMWRVTMSFLADTSSNMQTIDYMYQAFTVYKYHVTKSLTMKGRMKFIKRS